MCNAGAFMCTQGAFLCTQGELMCTQGDFYAESDFGGGTRSFLWKNEHYHRSKTIAFL